MADKIHATADTVYDPTANYESCCGPRNFDIGTTFRDTYDAAVAEAAREARERKAALRANQETPHAD